MKKERLPITKDILEQITSVIPISIEDLNIDTAFKVPASYKWANSPTPARKLKLEPLLTPTSHGWISPFWKGTNMESSDLSEAKQMSIIQVSFWLPHTTKFVQLRHCTPYLYDPQPPTAPLFRLTGRSTPFARNQWLISYKNRFEFIT